MIPWARLTLPLASFLIGACADPVAEVVSTSNADSAETTMGPVPTSSTTPGEDTLGTMGATGLETTMGAVDTTWGATTLGDETTMGVSSSGSESTTGEPPPPACAVPEDCHANETCSAGGECVAVCTPWGPGHYDYCLTPLGGFDSPVLCGEPLTCINSSANGLIEVAVCGRSCATLCDCPGPLPTGDAIVTCGDIVGGSGSECYLSCANGETCPDGMVCRNISGMPTFCAHPVQPLAMYGNCDEVAAPCSGGTCGIYGTASVCTEGCANANDCDPAPAGATMAPACGNVFDPPAGNDCFLPCNSGADCPTGSFCVDVPGPVHACMW
jgi:hypothetical protein